MVPFDQSQFTKVRQVMRGCFKSQWFALKQPLALQINDHRLQVTASNNGFAWNIDCYHVLVPFRDAYSTVEVDGIKCAQCVKSFRDCGTELWLGELPISGRQESGRCVFRDGASRLTLVYQPKCFHIWNADFVCRQMTKQLQAIATGICLASQLINSGE